METYKCNICGMAVNASCSNCNEPLINDSIQLDDGSTVQVSKCPECEGKIKSPMCCGSDMTCKA
jgi:DNA-directed RNA polymerase subunit RPC12/RpoP|tara:strand:- start:2229 stop:2420 length:192 start_codon:yes stop_codon:yes gene_type:complete